VPVPAPVPSHVRFESFRTTKKGLPKSEEKQKREGQKRINNKEEMWRKKIGE
jgi:hypothetical protein